MVGSKASIAIGDFELVTCVGGMGGRKASIAIGAGTAVPLHADNRAAYRLQ